MRLAGVAGLFLAALAATAHAGAASTRVPFGVVDGNLGYYDRDTLQPVGLGISIPEAHAAPVLSPDGGRAAVGVSSPGSAGLPGSGRVGLWIVDLASPRVAREVRTGIATEAIVYPGVIGALLQNGDLVVVDPATGRIRSRRHVGYTIRTCGPLAARLTAQVGSRGVLVSELRANRAEVVIVEAAGNVRKLSVPIDTKATSCPRQVALAAVGNRAYLVGRTSIVEVDPASGRTVTHRLAGLGGTRSAAGVPGGLAVASDSGLRVFDPATWRARWQDKRAHSVQPGGATVVATGGGEIRGLDARTGRQRWRAPGRAVVAIAAGRVYVHPSQAGYGTGRVFDLATGRSRGSYPTPASASSKRRHAAESNALVSDTSLNLRPAQERQPIAVSGRTSSRRHPRDR